MEPQQYKNMTASWETSDDVMHSLDKTWDDLSDIATHTSDASSFHTEAKNYVDQQGGASASANAFQMFEGSGSVNLHLNQSTDDLSSGDIQDVKDAKTVLQNSGANKEDFTKKGYQKWTGEDYSTGSTQIKNLDLQMISTADLISNMTLHLTFISDQGVQQRGYERSIDSLTLPTQNWLQILGMLMATIHLPQDPGWVGGVIPRVSITEQPNGEIFVQDSGDAATLQIDGSQSHLLGLIIRTTGPPGHPPAQTLLPFYPTLVITRGNYNGLFKTSIANNNGLLTISGKLNQMMTLTLEQDPPVDQFSSHTSIKVWLMTVPAGAAPGN